MIAAERFRAELANIADRGKAGAAGVYALEVDPGLAAELLEERDQLLSMVREYAPEGIEQACDECGGDDAECPADCVYRRARALLAGKPVPPVERLRAACTALAALVQRDRVSLYQAHRNPVTGEVDEDGQQGLDEYDAALALADAAMGSGR